MNDVVCKLWLTTSETLMGTVTQGETEHALHGPLQITVSNGSLAGYFQALESILPSMGEIWPLIELHDVGSGRSYDAGRHLLAAREIERGGEELFTCKAVLAHVFGGATKHAVSKN